MISNDIMSCWFILYLFILNKKTLESIQCACVASTVARQKWPNAPFVEEVEHVSETSGPRFEDFLPPYQPCQPWQVSLSCLLAFKSALWTRKVALNLPFFRGVLANFQGRWLFVFKVSDLDRFEVRFRIPPSIRLCHLLGAPSILHLPRKEERLSQHRP